MPPFAGLSDTQVWQLVSYIRSLKRDGVCRRCGWNSDTGDRQCGERRNALLRARRVRNLSRGERAWRHRRTRSLGAGRNSVAALRQKIVDPTTRFRRLLCRRARGRRRTWRACAGNRDRQDAGWT